MFTTLRICPLGLCLFFVVGCGQSGDNVPPKAEVKPKEEKKVEQDRWADAASDRSQLGIVSVEIRSVQVAAVPLKFVMESTASKERLLSVNLSIRNHDTAKKRDYKPWSGSVLRTTAVRLQDDIGNNYKMIDFGIGVDVVGQQQNSESLYPNEKPLHDLLVFERPVEAAQFLYLTLPGENVSEQGSFAFQIPRAMWQERTKPDPVKKAFEEPKNTVEKKESPIDPQKIKEQEEEARKQAAAKKAEEREKTAARLLGLAQQVLDAGRTERAIERLEELVKDYPETESGKKGTELLKKLKQSKGKATGP